MKTLKLPTVPEEYKIPGNFLESLKKWDSLFLKLPFIPNADEYATRSTPENKRDDWEKCKLRDAPVLIEFTFPCSLEEYKSEQEGGGTGCARASFFINDKAIINFADISDDELKALKKDLVELKFMDASTTSKICKLGFEGFCTWKQAYYIVAVATHNLNASVPEPPSEDMYDQGQRVRLNLD